MIRATTMATEEIRNVYDNGGPIHGMFGRADVGMLLSEIDALRAELAEAQKAREDAERERDLADSLHKVAVHQRDGANYLVSQTEKECENARAEVAKVRAMLADVEGRAYGDDAYIIGLEERFAKAQGEAAALRRVLVKFKEVLAAKWGIEEQPYAYAWGAVSLDAEQLLTDAKAAVEEYEHSVHMRVRGEYDRTIADSWRAKIAEIEAKHAAAVASLIEPKIHNAAFDLGFNAAISEVTTWLRERHKHLMISDPSYDHDVLGAAAAEVEKMRIVDGEGGGDDARRSRFA